MIRKSIPPQNQNRNTAKTKYRTSMAVPLGELIIWIQDWLNSWKNKNDVWVNTAFLWRSGVSEPTCLISEREARYLWTACQHMLPHAAACRYCPSRSQLRVVSLYASRA